MVYFGRMEEKPKLSRRQFLAMVGPAFRGNLWYYALIVVFIIAASAAQVAEPVISGWMIDALVANAGDGLFRSILPLIAYWALAFFLTVACSEIARWLCWRAANTIGNTFLVGALDRILGWDPQRFSDVASGVVGKRLDKAWDAMHNLSGRIVTDVLPIFFTWIAVFLTGLWLDWRMTLLSLMSIPIAITLTLTVYAKTDKRQSEHMEAWEQLSRRIQETLSNIVPIKAFAQESMVSREQRRAIERVTDRQLKLNVAWAWLDFSNGTVRILARFILLIAGAYFISKGTLSVGTLITFIGMLSYLLAPFDYTLADIMRRVSEIRTAFARLAPDWFLANSLIERPDAIRLRQVAGEIAFDQVSFAYPNKTRNAISRVSLHIPAGSSLALVGPSGGGKSSLVRFVNRFLDPTKGRVLLDGHDLKDLRIVDIRRSVGVVQQDTVLFDATIFENVRFVRPRAGRAEVESACKRAQAHEFIQQLPNGYDTMVGERGVKLSGGERQRIALARVFLASPPILVLDESTSALDSETEHKLQAALKDVMRGRTTIIIAHRLSTVYMADQIAVLERGRITEMGTHADLLEQKGMYERLWKLQSGGYLPE